MESLSRYTQKSPYTTEGFEGIEVYIHEGNLQIWRSTGDYNEPNSKDIDITLSPRDLVEIMRMARKLCNL